MEELSIIEHDNKRVLLTSQLAESYGTTNDVITKNFNRNKERYLEGKHYYCLSGQDKKEFLNQGQFVPGLKNAKNIYLWTERGAFLHAKSLNTDKAWDVYDSLVEHYFKSQEAKATALPQNYKEALLQLVAQVEENERLQLENEQMKPKADFADAVQTSKNSILVGQLAKIIKGNGVDIGQNRLFEWMRENGYLIKSGNRHNQPTQYSMDLGLMEVKETVRKNQYGENIVCSTTKITGKGQLYFVNLFRKEMGQPKLKELPTMNV